MGSAGTQPDCTGDAQVTLEGFSPLANSDVTGFSDDAFTCYQILPNPAFGYHGHIHADLIADSGEVATADADCQLVNLGTLPMPTPVDCTYSSSSPALPHGHFTLQVRSDPAGVVPVPIGSWQVAVVMDH
jgi:hypothetical protein